MTYDIYKFRMSVDITGGFKKAFEKMCSVVRNFTNGRRALFSALPTMV